MEVDFDDENCALHETKAYFAFLEKYAHALGGAAITLCAAAILFLGL